jgi:signal peptidase II
MAFGMKFGGDWGKLVLTVFRILACIWGVYFIQTTLIKGKYHNGLIFCASLILAGAIGNSIDSIFYGKIFSESYHSASQLVPWGQGYGELFHGKVVDMLYFPVLTGTFPSWVPIWGGEPFEFFRPVFNIADASISSGVISIFVFQTIFFKSKEEVFITETEENKHAEDVDPLILSEDTELES